MNLLEFISFGTMIISLFSSLILSICLVNGIIHLSSNSTSTMILLSTGNISFQILSLLTVFYNPNSFALTSATIWDGYLLLLEMILGQLQLLKVSLNTKRKTQMIVLLQIWIILFHCCTLGGTYISTIFTHIPDWIHDWNLLGMWIWILFFVLYQIIQSIYITSTIMKHTHPRVQKSLWVTTLLFVVLLLFGSLLLYIGYYSFDSTSILLKGMIGGFVGYLLLLMTLFLYLYERTNHYLIKVKQDDIPMNEYPIIGSMKIIDDKKTRISIVRDEEQELNLHSYFMTPRSAGTELFQITIDKKELFQIHSAKV